MARCGLALSSLCTVFCLAAQSGGPDLNSLFDDRRWFELRDVVWSRDTPAFYRVVVSCAFDDLSRAEKQFQQLTTSDPLSPETFEAHGMLASAHMRVGHYTQALSHLQSMQAVKPDYAGLSGAVGLLLALSQQPQPAVGKRGVSEVRLSQDMFIPLSVNGKQANYGFDTGMDLSVMTEYEARRLGVAIHNVPGSAFQDGASGVKVGIRFAIVRRLVLGGFELKNVTFLIVRNDATPFAELPDDKQGILGFPVLRTFETMRWNKTGIFQVGFHSDAKSRKPNLCVPGNSSPVVEGFYGPNRINVVLDTGSGTTVLTPRFAKDFPGLIAQSGVKAATRLRGLGGSTEVEVISLPEFRFHAGGFDFVLRPAQVLPKDSSVDRDSYHVWVGMDVLGQAHSVMLDFLSMRFEVE